MRFKIGQKVQVRKDLHCTEDYGSNTVVKEMMPMAGKMVTIISYIEDDSEYRILECDYQWTPEMFYDEDYAKTHFDD